MKKALTLLTLALSGTLLAQPQLPLGALRKQLNLTDAQVQQFKDLRKQQAEQLRPQREQMRAAAKGLRELMASENPDPAAVGKRMLELKGQRQSLRQSREGYLAKARALLTPDQQKKLDEWKDRRGGRARAMRRQAW